MQRVLEQMQGLLFLGEKWQDKNHTIILDKGDIWLTGRVIFQLFEDDILTTLNKVEIAQEGTIHAIHIEAVWERVPTTGIEGITDIIEFDNNICQIVVEDNLIWWEIQ